MIAPSGGFCPAGSSGGSGVSVLLFHSNRERGLRLEQDDVARASSSWICRSGVMSSRIQNAAAVRPDDEVVVLDRPDRGSTSPACSAAATASARRRRTTRRPASRCRRTAGPCASGSSRTALIVAPSGSAVRDLRPGLAAVVRAVDVRPQVVEPERVDRGVRASGVEVRGVDHRDLGPRRRAPAASRRSRSCRRRSSRGSARRRCRPRCD